MSSLAGTPQFEDAVKKANALISKVDEAQGDLSPAYQELEQEISRFETQYRL